MPYLAAAFVCEKVLGETDNVASAIRIVDTFTIAEPSELPTAESPDPKLKLAIQTPHFLFLSFKSGRFRGEIELRIKLKSPKKTYPGNPIKLVFADPPEGGATIKIPLAIAWDGPGLYWNIISLGRTEYTRIPMRFRLQQANQTEKPAGGPNGKTD